MIEIIDAMVWVHPMDGSGQEIGNKIRGRIS